MGRRHRVAASAGHDDQHMVTYAIPFTGAERLNDASV